MRAHHTERTVTSGDVVVIAAAVALWMMDQAQAVAARVEADRGRPHVVAAMPKPSKAFVDAWAAETIAAPLFFGDPRAEASFGLLWAFHESSYRDKLVGDGGKSICALQVQPSPSFNPDGWTPRQILDDPAKCVKVARRIMAWSFLRDPIHPMSQYAGGLNPTARAIADSRTAQLKTLLISLAPLGDELSP